jgi:hypothetical protein
VSAESYRDGALAVVNELGIDAVVTCRGDMVKCYLPDEEGGRYKSYLSQDDCERLSSAFSALAGLLMAAAAGDAEKDAGDG